MALFDVVERGLLDITHTRVSAITYKKSELMLMRRATASV